MGRKDPLRVLTLAIAMILLDSLGWAQDVTIVVNSGLSISQITETELRDIFIGVRSRFDDGTRALPVLLKGGPAHEVFLHRHIRETPDEFRVRWRKAVFTGQGSMPKEFSSEAELLHYVEATPGAIGYVSRRPDRITIKILTISVRD
jgi:hypothetical protein